MTNAAAPYPLPAGLVTDAIARYDLGPDVQVALLRHGENTNYSLAAADGRRFVLRVHRPQYQTLAAIRSELEWMAALRASGIHTPAPVPGIDGDLVQAMITPDGSARMAVLFEWIEGVPLSTVVDVAPWQRLGELMARIHDHARDWERPAWFQRPAWDAEALVGDRPRWGPPDPEHVLAADDRAALESCRAEVRARMDALGTAPDRYGLIHADLGFENVLVSQDGAVTVIDFDDCGDGWYLHEFAVALYPHDQTPGLDERRDALVAGYRAVRELPEEHLAQLPTFMMTRRIQTLGWVFSRSETAHAARQRTRRLATTPQAAREFLAWAKDNPR